jgi:hypothetical protein
VRPDEGRFLLRFLLPQLKSEQAITKKILSSVPPDKGDYKPHPKCMSAFELAWHLAVVEIWFLDAVIHRHFAETTPMPAGVKTGDDVAQWYEDARMRRGFYRQLSAASGGSRDSNRRAT